MTTTPTFGEWLKQRRKECLVLSQELGYGKGEADALLGLGQLAHNGWYDQDAAQRYLEKALTIYRDLCDLRGISYATVVSSYVAILQADLTKARVLAEECLALADQTGFSNPWPLLSLSSIALLEGNLIEARSLMNRALPNLEAKGHRASTLQWLGIIATIQDNFVEAHVFLDELLILLKELGGQKTTVAALPLAMLAQKEGDQNRALQWYRSGLPGVKYGTDTLRLGILGLADLAISMNQYELAARLLGATTSDWDAHHEPIMPFERDDYDRLADATRIHLGTARFDASWAEGRALACEQIAQEAVSILEASLSVRDHITPAS